jgi:hypothetical protein
MRSSFWRFLQNFSSANVLKIKLNFLAVVVPKEVQNELLGPSKSFFSKVGLVQSCGMIICVK